MYFVGNAFIQIESRIHTSLPKMVALSPLDTEQHLLDEDPKIRLEKECQKTPKCQPLLEKFMNCEKRVLSKKKTKETCLEELYDLTACSDKCVIFAFLLHN